ncbi:MAG: 6-bladed beta-propeller [Nitrospiraceae bacterium]|nr:MAG: 6-bladed beta-propeller [Nitrospiraceae bacterium]
MKYLQQTCVCIFILLSVVSTTACFKQIVESRKPVPDIIWPKPPDVPRIRLLNSISAPEDMNIREEGLSRFIRFVKGETNKSIVNPYGVVTDREGRLYIVDNYSRLVHVFDQAKGSYYTFPDEATSLISPIGIAIDSSDTIYVSDSKEAVIKIFRAGGKKYIGEMGRGVLERPTGVAYNALADELLVVDTQSSEIIKYDTVGHKVRGIIGREGNIEGHFYKPTNIAVAADGRLIISDSLNFRVQILSPEGVFISAFGKAGDGPGYFSRPRGVASDSDGNVYVVDALFDNIQVFDSQGRLLMVFGNPGNGYGEFWLPSGIYIDADDSIYVSDSYNHRVQIFKYLKGDEFIK